MKLENIKVIGFDLDQTLYSKSEEVDKVIQDYIFKKISIIKNWKYEKSKEEWDKLYPKIQSGRKTLEILGITTGGDIVQDALENADIAKTLKPDIKVNKLLNSLSKKYKIDLITGSSLIQTIKKLKKLEIGQELFNNILCHEFSKTDGTAYTYWLSLYPNLKPLNFVYIGDRLNPDVIKPNEFGIKGILVNNPMDKNLKYLQFETLIEIEKLF